MQTCFFQAIDVIVDIEVYNNNGQYWVPSSVSFVTLSDADNEYIINKALAQAVKKFPKGRYYGHRVTGFTYKAVKDGYVKERIS